MSGYYLRDKVRIYNVIKTSGIGDISISNTFESGAMIEDDSQMINDGAGRDVKAKYYFFLPPGTDVKIGDKIQVIERFGEAVTEKERTVIQASGIGGWKSSHVEAFA